MPFLMRNQGHKSCFTMLTLRGTFNRVNLSLKSGISIVEDSGPPSLVL